MDHAGRSSLGEVTSGDGGSSRTRLGALPSLVNYRRISLDQTTLEKGAPAFTNVFIGAKTRQIELSHSAPHYLVEDMTQRREYARRVVGRTVAGRAR